MIKSTPYLPSLPSNWTTATLGNLGIWIGGGTPSKSNPAFWEGDIPWVSPKDIKTDVITESEDRITQEALEQSATRLVPSGSILIVIRSGILEHTLPAAIAGLPVSINQDIKALIPYEGIDSRYVAFALRNYTEPILSQCSKAGTTVSSINFERIKQFEIALPPLAEQQRIASKLELAFSKSRRTRKALDSIPVLLRKLHQAALTAAFRGDLTSDWRAQHPNIEASSKLLERVHMEHRRRTEAMEKKGQPKRSPSKRDAWTSSSQEPETIDISNLPSLPPTWCWTSIGSLLKQIDAGHSPQALGRPAMAHETGVLKVSAVSWGEFRPEENKALPHNQAPNASISIKPNDLLISRANTPELVGAVVLTKDSHPNLMLSDKTLRLVPIDIGISKEYLLYALRTHWVRTFFSAESTGTSKSMQNLSQEKIRSAPIALAPLEEQQIIIQQIRTTTETHKSLLTHRDSAAQRLAALEHSILAKAFCGELIPQDPDDESASILLSRLKQFESQASAQPTARRTRARSAASSLPITPVPNRNEIPWNYLALIVEKSGGRIPAITLYKSSGLAVDDFYAQLRTECGDQKPLRTNSPSESRDVYIEVAR
ncbi:restriction endonuclease subunit S [Corallococcus exiguus]|uniref:restriction endonuclease subunit S n=1 Tax=Corallococcus exiguus TaxID=83462 RepID=UPI0015605D93|nr:restriction endonuclease subunit S [Corallococcus exiguus]NRD55709.1 restriction endonuclease subunit S [Corallococcus exiguus]